MSRKIGRRMLLIGLVVGLALVIGGMGVHQWGLEICRSAIAIGDKE